MICGGGGDREGGKQYHMMSKKRVKILLLCLPENIYSPLDCTSKTQPYGLAMISATLKGRGYDVTLCDAGVLFWGWEKILAYCGEVNPDIVGLTMMTCNCRQTIEFLTKLKEQLPGVLTVLGGPHPTVEYLSVLENYAQVDVCCVGEGEHTMCELVDVVENGGSLDHIKGIAFRKNGSVFFTGRRSPIEDLDALPFADWASLPMERYFFQWQTKKNYAALSLSRGCRFACTFCAHRFIGNRVRRRSPDNIIEELELLYHKHGVRQFEFNDSAINSDNEWLMELCRSICAMNVKISWGCQYRADLADEQVLKLMKKSGCTRLFVGVESADNRMLQVMKKGESIEKITHGLAMIHESGLIPDLGFVLGMPGEDERSLEATINYAKQYKKNSFAFTLATPYPGTEFYEIAKKEGWIVDDWGSMNMHHVSYVPPGLSKKQLAAAYHRAVREVLLRPGYIVRQILRLESWVQLKVTCRYAHRLFFKRLFYLRR